MPGHCTDLLTASSSLASSFQKPGGVKSVRPTLLRLRKLSTFLVRLKHFESILDCGIFAEHHQPTLDRSRSLPRSLSLTPILLYSLSFRFFACLLGDKWEQLLTFNLQLFVLVQQIWSSSGSALTALPQRTSTSDRRVKSIVLQTSR